MYGEKNHPLTLPSLPSYPLLLQYIDGVDIMKLMKVEGGGRGERG